MSLTIVMYFSDLGQCCRPAQKTVSKIKNLAHRASKYFRPLLSWCKQERGHRQQNSRITDRQILFLDLCETCLYMVHFDLGPFFRKTQKSVYIGLPKN